jgi:TPR repeat protein
MASKKRRMLNNHALELARLPKLKDAAERGDLDAQHGLGAFYATDELLGLKDEAEAVKWYTKAAEQGHALSQYDLGFMLLLGEGIDKDVAKGLWWMEQAVANGWEDAARLLSDVYTRGLFDVEANSDKATYWNKRAGKFKDRI